MSNSSLMEVLDVREQQNGNMALQAFVLWEAKPPDTSVGLDRPVSYYVDVVGWMSALTIRFP
jgi:hypothetical protein